MKRIAVFGGTFNPIHNGHIQMCMECCKRFEFDELLIIPSNIPPHKVADDLADNKHRFNMAKLAAQLIENADVSDIEFKLGDKSYTIFTLEELKKQNEDAEFFLIIGSDMLLTFHEWFRYRDILRLATVIAGGRAENITEEMKNAADILMSDSPEFSGKIKVLSMPINVISSTEIRSMVKNKIDIKKLVPALIGEYIKENKLYSSKGELK